MLLLPQPLQNDVPKLQPRRPRLPQDHEHDGYEKARVLAIEDAGEKLHGKPNGDDGVEAAVRRKPPDDKPLLSPAFLVPSLLTPGTQTSVHS